MSLHSLIYSAKAIFKPYFNELKDFHFTFSNPLFWLSAILLFLVLTRFWQSKKAFSFSIITVAVLLLTTRMEAAAETWFIAQGDIFDALAIRMVAFFIILMLFFYYSLIRN